MNRLRSIRSHLALLVAAAVLPLLVVSVYGSRRVYESARRAAEGEFESLAAVFAHSLESRVAELRRGLETVATRPEVRALDPEACDPVAQAIPGLVRTVMATIVLDAEGRVVCTTLPPTESGERFVDAGDRTYFRAVREGLAFYVDPPRTGYVTGAKVSVMSVPIRGADGSFAGAVAFSVDLIQLQLLLAEVDLPEGIVVTIADTQRVVVARSHRPQVWVGDTLPRTPAGVNHYALGSGTSRARGLDGEERLWGFKAVRDAGWMVYVGQPVAEVLAPARRTVIDFAVLILITAALVGGLSVYLYRRITGSLAALVEGAGAAMRGQSNSVEVAGVREVAEVARHFNRALEDRRSSEQSLAAAQGRFAAVAERLPLGICQVRHDGTIVGANRAFAEVAAGPGRPPPSSIVPLVGGEEAWAELRASVEEARAAGGGEAVDATWHPEDSGPRVVQVTGVPSGDETPGVYDLIVEDVTDRRRLENEMARTQKMEALGRMAGGVAHDFNNLLTVISGQTELILDELDEGHPDRDTLEQVAHAADRAAALTRQLLTFGRRDSVEITRVEINTVLEDLHPMLQSVAGEDIAVELELDARLHPVAANRPRLEQAILNLVINARDAIHAGGRIAVRTAHVQAPPGSPDAELVGESGTFVRLSVADDGCGMGPDVLDRIFEPFFTTKDEREGTGLGLAQVYAIVHQVGGRIRVESEPDRGTTFHLFFPVDAREGPDASEEMHAAAEGQEAGSAEGTILLAEDRPEVRGLIQRVLEDAGYTVLVTEDGLSALEMSRAWTGPIDLLLTDVVMPGMRGPELAEALGRERPGIAVCFISGYALDEKGNQAVPPGAPFIAKPFRPSVLLRRIADVLREAREEQSDGRRSGPGPGEPQKGTPNRR